MFGLLGIIIGLWSKSFEQLNMPVVFFLTPLSMVGGVFNTIAMLPDWLRWLAWANPFFYFINGIRGAMIGFDETPPGLGHRLHAGAVAGPGFLGVAALFQRVWPARIGGVAGLRSGPVSFARPMKSPEFDAP